MGAVAAKECRFSQAGQLVHDADLLLWRNGGCKQWWTRALTSSHHHHAGRAVWLRTGKAQLLFCCDLLEGHGGQLIPLKRYLNSYSEKIDVFRPDANYRFGYDRAGAVHWTLQHVPGARYGSGLLWRKFLQHGLIMRLFHKPDHRDESTDPQTADGLTCSAACAMADQWGGKVDSVPFMSNRDVEPGHLANSALYTYQFTLVPDAQESE